jgi:hypothetical protein
LSLGLIPTGSDHARMRLPRTLYPLYYVARPLRLAMEAVAMMIRRAARVRAQPADATEDSPRAPSRITNWSRK